MSKLQIRKAIPVLMLRRAAVEIVLLGLTLVILMSNGLEAQAETLNVVVTDHKGRAITDFHWDRTKLLPVRSTKLYIRKDNDDIVYAYADVRRHPNSIPITPQSFGQYIELDKPSIWIRIIDLDTDKEIEAGSIPAGHSEKTFSVPPGRYLILSGTTIQVDERGEWPTDVPVPPKGDKGDTLTLQRLPDIPSAGTDEKGQWECYGLADVVERLLPGRMGGYESFYVYDLLKRYTYDVIGSTVTYVSPGEKTDHAYVPLLTDPDKLAALSAPTKSVEEQKILEKWDPKKTIPIVMFRTAGKAVLEGYLKYSMPIAAAHSLATGILAGAATNIVYLGIYKPSAKFEEVLATIGAAAGVDLFVMKISPAIAAVAGVPHVAVAITIGVVAKTLIDKIVHNYEEGEVRKRAAKAFFDDVWIGLQRDDKGNIKREVYILCAGLMATDVRIGVEDYHGVRTIITEVPRSCLPNMSWVRLYIRSGTVGEIYGRWFSLDSDSDRTKVIKEHAFLIADVPIVYGSDEHLNDLTWPLKGLVEASPKVSTSTILVVDVSGSMNWQDPSGKVKIEAAKDAAKAFLNMINSENNRGALHQISVVTFSSSASLALPLTTDLGAARKTISRLSAVGGTNMAQGLSIANKELSRTVAKPIIILLSDGVPTVGMSGAKSGQFKSDYKDLQKEVLEGPVREAANHGYCIYVVGFGKPGEWREGTPSIDPEFLKQIAQATGCGHYYNALDAVELANTYIKLRHQSTGTIVGEFSGQIKRNETVEIGKVTIPPHQEELRFTLSWPGSQLDPILIDPKGRKVDEKYPGATIDLYSNLVYVIIAKPLRGVWTAKAFGREVPQGTIKYSAILSTREGLPPGLVITTLVGLILGIYFLLIETGKLNLPRRTKAMLGLSNAFFRFEGAYGLLIGAALIYAATGIKWPYVWIALGVLVLIRSLAYLVFTEQIRSSIHGFVLTSSEVIFRLMSVLPIAIGVALLYASLAAG